MDLDVQSDTNCSCDNGGPGGVPIQPDLDPRTGIVVRSKPGILIGNIINKLQDGPTIIYELDDFTLVKPVVSLSNNGPAVVEVGATVSSVLFSGSIAQGSYPIATRSLSPSESVDLTNPFTFTKTNIKLSAPGLGQQHTLQATDNEGNTTTIVNGVPFKYAFFMGFNSLAVLDQTAIQALANKNLIDSFADQYGGLKTYVVPNSPTTPKYLYWCGPIGSPVIQGAIMNGLPLPLTDPGNVTLTNINDNTIQTQYWVRRTSVRFDPGTYQISLG